MTTAVDAVAHQLPVAGPAQVRAGARELLGRERRTFAAMIGLNALAALAGLAGPWLVGRIVDQVRAGAGVGAVDRLAMIILACAIAQLLLTRYARLVAHRFGERTSAYIRERYLKLAMALPSSVVERAGAGDLAARGTGDVGTVATTLRDAGPDVLVASVHSLFILGAVFAVSPLLGLCSVATMTGIWFAVRWYSRRAPRAYLAEGAAHSTLAEILAATATGARTVEVFGLQQRRIDACRSAVAACRDARERTLRLRSVLFPSIDVSYVLPVVAALLVGAALLARDAVSLGAVVSTALYLRLLSQPMDTILQRVEQLQASTASFARIEGLAGVPRADTGDGCRPEGEDVHVEDIYYAYDGRGDVLHGVTLDLRPGERVAVVGPSGAGKTTLGRLLAGIEPPRAGTVTIGGCAVQDLAPELRRRHIMLVTQEYHVFLGTVRDNLHIASPGATDAELLSALAAVGADWVTTSPQGLETILGDDIGGLRLNGSQVQQLGLARVILADPHLLVLDEATALLDPQTARHTERALAAVLEGRTVVAIAHRLHTARDADRVAVMEHGRLTEVGTHDELLEAGGSYARLWRSWHG